MITLRRKCFLGKIYTSYMLSFNDLKFRAAYWAVGMLDKHKEIHFMNYGYHDPDEIIPLQPSDEKNRYAIQLYKHLIDFVDLGKKDIVEIGSGRGGGLAYVARNYAAKTVSGIDLDKGAVAFSNNHYKLNNLSFSTGDAQNLPLPNDSCDILLNVESSHRYPQMERFLNEVTRVLRKGGHFLYTDFLFGNEWDGTDDLLRKYNLKILRTLDITPKVIKALEMNDQQNRAIVKKLAPKFLQKVMLNFAGVIDSETYNNFRDRRYVYRSYVFQKY
jgi:ubiquinone/menaquinone biosynthesis C-methylase UbiE